MPVDRPTFSESWYRISTLKPALRTVVQTYRQHYRGRMWHVLRDPSNNQFFRLDDAGFTFVGMLDGRRTVADVWEACNEQLGDRAPTQGEAIQLLGQLFTSNLLSCELPADAASMFERYRKRVRREVGGYFMNLLFLRIPLFDPERILERWVGVFGWVFGKVGIALWAILIGYALTQLTGHWGELIAGADPQLMLKTENIFLLYGCFAVIKAIHEFGHGFACKRFGQLNGSGGEVHTIGIMLLVLMPVPYVDASSSWAFRNKWQRAFVGAAGMYVELAVAAIAAIVWVNTSPGIVHDICYNVMFIASVSTLLFNGNPLLRYDGYYILSDILEIPNMGQRSREYFYYLVKKYVYRARRPRNPAHTAGEKFWLLLYCITSSIYRVFISVAILLYITSALEDVFFFAGVVLALSGLIGWLVVPLSKWVKYLALNDEIARTRAWSIGVTVAFFGGIITFIGFYPWPEHGTAEGVTEPIAVSIVPMGVDGWIENAIESGERVSKGDAIVRAKNRELELQRESLAAELAVASAEARKAGAEGDLGLRQAHLAQRDSIRERLARVERDLEALKVTAPLDGEWNSPHIEFASGTFAARGDQLGVVATTDQDKMLIRAVADQTLGPRIQREVIDVALREGRVPKAEVRIKGRPGDFFEAEILRVLPAGQDELPSKALGYVVGGSVEVAMDEQEGDKAAEPVFEIRLKPLHQQANADALAEWEALAAKAASLNKPAPPKPTPIRLLSGQRLVIRFTLPDRPLGEQWWLAVTQLLQQRFKW